jgi:hypothetical protein
LNGLASSVSFMERPKTCAQCKGREVC